MTTKPFKKLRHDYANVAHFMITNQPVAFLWADKNLRVQFISPELKIFLPERTLETGGLLTELWHEMVGLEDRLREIVNEESKPFTLENINLDLENGETRYVTFILYAGKHNRRMGLYAVVRDTTDTGRLIQELNQSRNELSLLKSQLIHTNSALARTNKVQGMNIVAAAQEVARLYKQAREEISERKKIARQLEISLEEREYMLHEIHRQAENDLQIISSLLTLQKRETSELTTAYILAQSQERIQSIVLAYKALRTSPFFGRIDLGEYTQTLTEGLAKSYQHINPHVSLKQQHGNVYLGIEQTVSCGLIINELITNALKHGFLEQQAGEISVETKQIDKETAQLIVRDNGVGLPSLVNLRHPKRLGMKLVNTLIHQLGGKVLFKRKKGLETNITFPIQYAKAETPTDLLDI